jgi:O-antigen ligase
VIQNKNNFSWSLLLAFLAAKPFIDLTWYIKLPIAGSFGLSLLEISAVGLFFWGLASYLRTRTRSSSFSVWIWMFLIFSTLASIRAYGVESANLAYLLNSNIRLWTAFLLFFVGGSYLNSFDRITSFLRVVWLSTLAVSVFSLAVYIRGGYNIDITGGITRFAGIYNDAGGPSYNALMALFFSSFFLNHEAKVTGHNSPVNTILFLATLVIVAIILKITVTKSALGMLFVFTAIWWVYFQRKWWLVFAVPLIFLWIGNTEFGGQLESRFKFEKQVIIDGDYSEAAIRSIGTGRGSTWIRLIGVYSNEYDLTEKIMGRGRSFGAHNQYLAELMRTGLVGLALFVGVLSTLGSSLLAKYRKTKVDVYAMGFSLLMVFVALGLTGHPFYYTTHLWYLMLLLSTLNLQQFRKTLPKG